jgi:hypothetical protein
MDTDETQDDVLILADPYDTTDHNQDGYYLEAFERLVYGWGAAFDSHRNNVFFVPYLADTGIPAQDTAALPEDVLKDIASVLASGIEVSNIDAFKDSGAVIDKIKDILKSENYDAGADYAIADAAVLSGGNTDFDSSKAGKVTLTVRIRCGTEVTTLPVTLSVPAVVDNPTKTDKQTSGVTDTKAGTEPPEQSFDEPFPFSDVAEGIWYYDNVYYMWKNGLMKGTSNTLFSPDTALSRGMVVTVLYRMAGGPDVSDLINPFGDVAGGLYYTDAIIWAADKNIVLGYSNDKFGPGDSVTREQLAAILCRYQQLAGKTPPDIREAIAFTDENSISDYAKGFVNTLVMQGIINGKDNNTFDPKGNATRAELAAMFHKYSELAMK